MLQSSNRGWLTALALALLAAPHDGNALPSFAAQTGQPCAACHVGAFGPQLKPFGRDFKLYGYTATDGKPWSPPISMTVEASFTHTQASQPGGAARWFAPNDNPALDQTSLYYAGRIEPHTGAFIELLYDGVARQLQPGNIDIRHARDFTLFGIDAVGGITLNNAPTVQDLWNSTPVWGFPYNHSPVAPTPAQAVLSDGGLSQRVVGLGLYAMWNEILYTELTAYRGVGRDVLNATGVVPVSGAPGIDGFTPYWRVAIQKDLQRHFFQIGTYGLNANIFPGGNQTAGTADTYTDMAADASYQFIINPKNVTSDMLSAHAVLVHENQSLGASSRLLGTNGSNTLDTFRADASYSFGATVTPTLQYFRTSGSADAVQFNTATGRPNSSGVVAEVAYVPWGKPDSPIQFLNLRFAVQYVAYTEFDGTSHAASANNTLYLSLWGALHF
jgi:hypothetical protein